MIIQSQVLELIRMENVSDIANLQDHLSYYSNTLMALLQNLSLLIGREDELPSGEEMMMVQPQPQPDDGTEGITLNVEAQVPVNYEVFNSHTRMLFDWSARCLFLLRRGLPYLAFTEDKQTNVQGWSRGDMEIEDGVFLSNLPYRPPEILPTVFGIKGNNVLMLSKGINSRKESFIDNLPNCLDEFVLLNKVGNELNLSTLKASLINIGYQNNDIIVIATDKGIIFGGEGDTKILADLNGVKEVTEGAAYIVGKPSPFILKNYHPASARQAALGKMMNIVKITMNAILHTDFQINNNLVFKEQNVYAEAGINGSEFIRYVLQTPKDYNPIMEIKGTSPFPFAIGGYILDINVAPKG